MKKSSNKLALRKDIDRTLVGRELVNVQGGAADPSRKETFCDSVGATCNSTGIRCH
jgi:hypothetical protein